MVSYNTNGFTAKNKDEFPQQLIDIIEKTNNQYIKKICIIQDDNINNNSNVNNINIAIT